MVRFGLVTLLASTSGSSTVVLALRGNSNSSTCPAVAKGCIQQWDPVTCNNDKYSNCKYSNSACANAAGFNSKVECLQPSMKDHAFEDRWPRGGSKSLGKRAFETFEDYKRDLPKSVDTNWLQRTKRWEKDAEPEWTKEHEKMFGPKTENDKNQCNCGENERCVRVDDFSTKMDGDARNLAPAKHSLFPKPKFKCLKSCKNVCTKTFLKCDGLKDEYPSYPLHWWEFENQPCYQVEVSQGAPFNLFMRTSCRCPDRDYSVSDSCNEFGQSASLSNCVQGWLVQSSEINFQDLSDVQLGYIESTGADVDFQGSVEHSQFCRVTAYEDVEFGGEECPANIQYNVFWEIDIGDDLQFEEGTAVNSNIFFNIDMEDDFKIQDETALDPTTTVTNNIFLNVNVDSKCRLDPNAASLGPLNVNNNYCSTFDEGSNDNTCATTSPFNSGFSCL